MRRKNPQKKSTQHALHNLHNSRPIIVDIIDLSRGGAGFGRDENGRATFVPFTMPGDKVKVKLTTAKSKYAEGNLLDIIEPSSKRVDAPCKAFTKCGGCQWQHIPYDTQWETKKQGVINSLSLNNIKLPAAIEGFPAESTWHYRNRVQLRGYKDEIGFYANQSNTLVAIEQCEIAHANINSTLSSVKEKGKEFKKPYKVELNLLLDGTVAETWNDEHASSGFRQVNDDQNEKLKAWISELIPDNQPLLDLYGGAGNLSIPLMDRVPEIHCVDSSTPENEQPAAHFHYHRAAVEPWLQQQTANGKIKQQGPWTALIDPPRDGLGKTGETIVQYLKQLNVTAVVLVGCKTDPWSRDIAHFIEQGWKLKKVAVLDFFPQTYHVESAAFLIR
ncbi:MAG: TRAM domain-containing protein [Gammaproteobacteria bacterium]|nr:TRAM domain-containing protein [Gammaproteobacteria bacterium]